MNRHSRFAAYTGAVLITAVALIARMLMNPGLGIRIPYATFYVAVAVASTLGGLGPGILAMLLGSAAVTYFVVPPRHTLWIQGGENQLGFALYVGVSSTLIILAEMQRRVKARLEQQVAARIQAEEALRVSERSERARAAELDAIMQAVPIAIFIARDAECREIVGNRMSYDLLGLPDGSNLSMLAPDRAIGHGPATPVYKLPLRRAVLKGQPVRNYELEVVSHEGTSRFLLGDTVPLLGEAGRPHGAVAAFVDITDRKRAEEALRQSQKLESIGLLAGGIAHDFNNLLTVILGNARMVLDKADAQTAELIKAVIGSSERAAELTRQLLAYSGKGQLLVQEIGVSDAIDGIRDLLRSSIPDSVRLTVNCETPLPPVWVDPGQLQQIVVNVVINAGEAIGAGNPGQVSVSNGVAEIGMPFIDATGHEVAPGRYVWIEISDTGTGIDDETKAKIFDPFFTTKFTGRGLGLAAVSGIVRSQKGGITIQSSPGTGSTFRVFLPASERQHL